MGGHFLCLPIVCEKTGQAMRFLKEDCGLEFEVDENSYGEFIRKFIKE